MEKGIDAAEVVLSNVETIAIMKAGLGKGALWTAGGQRLKGKE